MKKSAHSKSTAETDAFRHSSANFFPDQEEIAAFTAAKENGSTTKATVFGKRILFDLLY